jgi:PPOX class probable F420-dependent enzyme
MARKMSHDEYIAFLGQGTRTAKIATTQSDGRPHVVPVWFVLDGDTVVFMTGESTAKGKHILRDPRVTMCVDDEMPPFSFVMIEGTVTTALNPPEMPAWSIRIARRYMGEAQAEAFGKRNAVDGEMLVRLTPTKIIAMAALSD